MDMYLSFWFDNTHLTWDISTCKKRETEDIFQSQKLSKYNTNKLEKKKQVYRRRNSRVFQARKSYIGIPF